MAKKSEVKNQNPGFALGKRKLYLPDYWICDHHGWIFAHDWWKIR